MNAQATCQATTKNGTACRSFAIHDGYCSAHSGLVDMSELASRGGVAKASKTAIRQAIADTTAANFESMMTALLEGFTAETTRYGTCECGKRVGVDFPDLHGRAKIAELLLNQGLGMPGVTLSLEDERDERLEFRDDDRQRHRELKAELEIRRRLREAGHPHEPSMHGFREAHDRIASAVMRELAAVPDWAD